MLALLASAVVLAAPPPSTAIVQIERGRVSKAFPLLRRAGAEEVGAELRIWRVPRAAVPGLRRAGVVELAQPERLLAPAATPTDPLVPLEWWRAAVGADRVDAPGPGKPVTVVDSGIDVTHPEFASRPNTTLLNPQSVNTEDDDHGTEVSSVVAAPADGVGLVGVYPLADLRSWDASPDGFLTDGSAIQGILAASRRGAGVINLSFGGPIDSPLLEQAVLFATRSGSLLVAAAGNSGTQGSPESFPADYAHVLTVGATGRRNSVAAFSSNSPWLDLAAPGVDIPVAEPTFVASSGYDVGVSGTSFSSPIVAGAAAWVWTARPSLDHTQLFEVMRRSARDIGAAGFDDASGFGLLDIPAALALPAPIRDPFEPNDDAAQIEPGALFTRGTPPLTSSGRRTGSVPARVDRREDPHDLYRVYVPAGLTVTATTAGGAVDLRLYPRLPQPLRRAPLATSARSGGQAERAAYRNTGTRAVYVYAEVRPGRGVADASYRLRVTTSARP